MDPSLKETAVVFLSRSQHTTCTQVRTWGKREEEDEEGDEKEDVWTTEWW